MKQQTILEQKNRMAELFVIDVGSPSSSSSSFFPASFDERVYRLVSQVPKGRVTTYKDIANALGSNAYRAVGQAMRRNPYAPAVPCHRVVASDGSIGGFFGNTCGEPVMRKIAMLNKEGVIVENGKVVDFAKRKISF